MDPPLATLLLILLIVSVTHFLGSFAAYGSSLLAMPFFMAATGDLEFSIGVLMLMGGVQSAVILRHNSAFIDWRKLGLICGGMILGAPIGVLLVESLPRREILLVLGGVLILSGLLGLFHQTERHRTWPAWLNFLVLMGAGAVHGAFASGGSVLILYARNAFTQKETFRATLAAVWICINALLLIRLAWSGQFQMRVLPAAAMATLVVMGAGLAAERLVARFSHRAFMILISLLLLLSGLVTLFRAA
ncbi:MAG: sulfite exporter TauE/SafE family protein [Opitutaceae bacterium]